MSGLRENNYEVYCAAKGRNYMSKRKKIKDLEKRVKRLEEYVDNENARRIEELRAAIKNAEHQSALSKAIHGETRNAFC
jgi:predicted  nucleic acid-binding Zn-ribbon protein